MATSGQLLRAKIHDTKLIILSWQNFFSNDEVLLKNYVRNVDQYENLNNKFCILI